jgi:poly(A) polymerase
MSQDFLQPQLRPFLQKLRAFLLERHVEAYLVGGYIRDCLLRRATNDVDMAVNAEAMELAREVGNSFGGRFVLLDEVNQVARVVFPPVSAESHQRWYLDFSTLRGDIVEDLSLRDFTINAMAVDLQQVFSEAKVPVIDPFGGRFDLERKTVRVVREEALLEDPARLLRAVRFAAELDFTIEESTKTLISRFHPLIAGVASERVRDEFCHILAAPKAAHSLRYLDESGLLGVIMPELTVTKGVEQPKEHFWDVFSHSLETVTAIESLLHIERSEDHRILKEALAIVPWSSSLAQHFDEEIGGGQTRRTILKLAALLHDIAKPQCKIVEESGRIRFLGHAQEGAAIAGQILERLRFSNREIKMVQKLIEYHLRPGQLANQGQPTRRAIYRYFRDTDDIGIDTLYLNLADHLAARGPQLDYATWQEHVETIKYVLQKRLEEAGMMAPPKLVDGHDLMNRFGLSPGPRIGELLESVQEAQAAGEVETKEEALALVEKQLTLARR